MSLAELLPALTELSKRDKIRAIQLLAEQLAAAEEVPYLQAGKIYPIWSPFDAFDAARSLRTMLDEEKGRQ
jgi:hypothetical protein